MTPLVAVDPLPAVTAPTVSAEQLALIKKTIAKDATPLELELYLFDCARRGIHPLDKLLHFSKRGGRYVPVTSIDYMRSRAALTREYAGQDDAVFTGTPKTADFTASVTVFRLVQGQRCAFAATARWSEYKPDHDFMWLRMPHTMLSKCSEALALRKGFPQELSGLYEAAELDQATSRQEVEVETGEIVDLPPRLITPAQRKRLFVLAGKVGWSNNQIKRVLLEQFKFDSSQVIPMERYDEICAVFSVAPPVETVDPTDQPF